MFERRDRLREVLKREVSQILLEGVDFGREVLITVSRVEISPDLSEARIYVSVLPDEFSDNVFSILRRKAGRFQKIINKVVNIKRTPKLIFLEEKEIREAARIDEILQQIKKGDKAR